MKIYKKTKLLLSDHSFKIVSYKISCDVLFLLLFSMVLALIIEAVLPGIVSQNNGFLILSFLLFGNIFAISYLGKKLQINFKKNSRHSILPFTLFFAFILIGNSLLKFSLIENLIITTSTTIIIALLYQSIFSEKS